MLLPGHRPYPADKLQPVLGLSSDPTGHVAKVPNYQGVGAECGWGEGTVREARDAAS